MPKFYLNKNTSKVVIDGRTFNFEAADYFEPTHSWWCVFAADSAADIRALDAAAARGLCEEISAEDYAIYESKKKTARVSGNITNLKHWHAPKNTISSGKPAEVVEEPQPRESAKEAATDILEPTAAPKLPRRRK